jgi:hypothetical protein
VFPESRNLGRILPAPRFLPLELVPCLRNEHTHLPLTSIRHLNIHPTIGDDSLQAVHDVRVGLKLNVIQYVVGCKCRNILDELLLGSQVDLLKFLD